MKHALIMAVMAAALTGCTHHTVVHHVYPQSGYSNPYSGPYGNSLHGNPRVCHHTTVKTGRNTYHTTSVCQ